MASSIADMARIEALEVTVTALTRRVAELEARVAAWTQVTPPRKKLTIPRDMTQRIPTL